MLSPKPLNYHRYINMKINKTVVFFTFLLPFAFICQASDIKGTFVEIPGNLSDSDFGLAFRPNRLGCGFLGFNACFRSRNFSYCGVSNCYDHCYSRNCGTTGFNSSSHKQNRKTVHDTSPGKIKPPKCLRGFNLQAYKIELGDAIY